MRKPEFSIFGGKITKNNLAIFLKVFMSNASQFGLEKDFKQTQKLKLVGMFCRCYFMKQCTDSNINVVKVQNQKSQDCQNLLQP